MRIAAAHKTIEHKNVQRRETKSALGRILERKTGDLSGAEIEPKFEFKSAEIADDIRGCVYAKGEVDKNIELKHHVRRDDKGELEVYKIAVLHH